MVPCNNIQRGNLRMIQNEVTMTHDLFLDALKISHSMMIREVYPTLTSTSMTFTEVCMLGCGMFSSSFIKAGNITDYLMPFHTSGSSIIPLHLLQRFQLYCCVCVCVCVSQTEGHLQKAH